jgi:hypothetical protein
MIRYFDYSSLITTINEKDYKEISYSSIAYTPQLPLKKSMLKTNILTTEQYRPDKISYRLFGDPNLSWLLDDINSFYSFSEYYLGREIYYLGTNGLSAIGIEVDYISYESQNY